jgi:hypothetical protein
MKNSILPIIFGIIGGLFAIQLFTGDTPSVQESVKILQYTIPLLFVLGGSHPPISRKYLIFIALCGIIALQFDDYSILYKEWYMTTLFIVWFMYYLSRGYSNTMFLVNIGRPKSVELKEASDKDTRGLRLYPSKPTAITRKPSVWGFVSGYIELGLTGAGYGTICLPLCALSGRSIIPALVWGSVYGAILSIGGFIIHKYYLKPITLDKWGAWELSAGIAIMISVAMCV